MTGLFFVLAMLAFLVTTVCGIWLLVLAFRESALWGLAVLFVPFAVVVFAIKFWNDCKKPFLSYLGGSVAAGVFLMLAVTSGVGAAIQEAQQQQASLAESAPSPVAAADSSPSPNATAVAPTPPRPRPRPTGVASRPTRTPSRSKLSFGNANDYVGRLIKVNASDGRIMKGYLVDAGSDRLVLEKDLTSGVFTFEVTRNDVKSLEVVR